MKIWKFFSFVSILLFSTQAFSTITLTNVTGVTRYTVLATGIEMIAGLAGPAGAVCSGTGLCNTCNSCTAAPTTPGSTGSCGSVQCCVCNETAVHAGTVFTMTFTSDTTQTGIPKLSFGSDGDNRVSTGGSGSGGRFTFTQTWDEICSLMNGGAGGCAGITTSPLTKTLRIEVTDGTTPDSAEFTMKIYNQDNTTPTSGTKGAEREGSIRAFRPFPGDKKVYIEDVYGAGNFPQSSTGIIKYIRFYLSTNNLSGAYIGSSDGYVDLEVDSEGAVDKVLDGLSNDVTYHFRPASVDEAGNIFNVMDDELMKNSGGVGADGISAPESICDINVTGGGAGDCRLVGTPSRVLGLLTEDVNCFVASAAYGSSLDPHLQTFRDFRYRVLLQSKLGQKLNFTYYKYGPYLARFISNNEWAKPLSRAILWPAWGLAKLSVDLKLQLWQSLSLFLIAIGSFSAALAYGFTFFRRHLRQLEWK